MWARRFVTLAALGLPQVALADLTVEEAWGVWTTQFEALGLEWTADATREDEALQVGPIYLRLLYPRLGLGIALQLPGPRFVPEDDGVAVSWPDRAEMPFSAGFETGDSENFAASGAFIMELEDVSITMRDTEAGIESRWAGERFEIALETFGVSGAPYPAQYRYVQRGFDISNVSTVADGWLDFRRDGRAREVVIAYGFGDETVTEGLEGQLVRNAVETATAVRLPIDGPVLAELAQQAANGMALTHEATASKGHDSDREFRLGRLGSESRTDWTDIRTTLGMSEEGLRLVSGARGVAMQMTDHQFDLTMDVMADGVGLNLEMPMLRRPEPQPFSLMFEVDQVGMSAESWQQFFDRNVLPLERVDAVIDLSGDMILLETLLDIEGLAALANETAPFTVETLDISRLFVGMTVGTLDATGALRFDHGDYDALDGFPATEGHIDADLNGINALIDRLLAGRVITSDQAMAARALIATLTTPQEGAGEKLRMEAVFEKDGRIMVNGQRMR